MLVSCMAEYPLAVEGQPKSAAWAKWANTKSAGSNLTQLEKKYIRQSDQDLRYMDLIKIKDGKYYLSIPIDYADSLGLDPKKYSYYSELVDKLNELL